MNDRFRFLVVSAGVTLALAVGAVTGAADAPATRSATRDAPHADVRRTVEAMVGRWEGQMHADVPGTAAESFPWTIECREAALGAGAACTMHGEASIGAIAQSCLLAFDPADDAVHYMCVTSMGEVHDHRGHWEDTSTLAFEPHRGGLRGMQVEETIRWRFHDDRLETHNTIARPDGDTMRFRFVGRRR